jgi:hypothetical protein
MVFDHSADCVILCYAIYQIPFTASKSMETMFKMPYNLNMNSL